MKEVLTTCPYCGCGCGFYLMVNEKEEITGVVPSAEHPVSRGRLCVKGWNVFEFINSPDRLLSPLAREAGSLRETGWDDALNKTAGKLKEIIKKYGPDAVGFFSSAKCTNEENYLFMKFARAVVGTNNIDHCARL
ncbi:formate dehydrogenase subunit alpha [Thermincola ferriacetica]|uniref:Formate dehydrogenase subunit alpha n=1 Tax=Thermincola ferriacetica TaxID=281456 RepID=A0A0L6W2M9_9FIRM|nr:formate dehydrogenase subunit alpha [Thermincola ferriacetica]